MSDDLIHNVQIEQERSKKKDFFKDIPTRIEDPFVTAGLIALQLLTKKPYNDCTDKDLQHAAEQIVSYYLTPSFSSLLQSIFPNSKYINYQVKDKKRECYEFLNNIIESRHHDEEKTATCQLCGEPTLPTLYTNNIIPLIGTGEFVNFFPSWQSGVYACSRCILAIQTAPLIFYNIGGKPALISSSNHQLLEEYTQEAIRELRRKMAADFFSNSKNSAILYDGFKNPINAIFHLAYKFGTQYPDAGICSRNETIVIYHFDNYIRNPKGVSIYKLPSGVFSFIAQLMNTPNVKKIWFAFINSHYKQKDEEEKR